MVDGHGFEPARFVVAMVAGYAKRGAHSGKWRAHRVRSGAAAVGGAYSGDLVEAHRFCNIVVGRRRFYAASAGIYAAVTEDGGAAAAVSDAVAKAATRRLANGAVVPVLFGNFGRDDCFAAFRISDFIFHTCSHVHAVFGVLVGPRT